MGTEPAANPRPPWPALLNRLADGGDLTAEEAGALLTDALSGDASPARIAALLTALRAKGESASEVGAFVEVLLHRAVPVDLTGLDYPPAFAAGQPVLGWEAVDIVGTGGDGAQTANISTTAAFLVAACGVPVLKHGNRAVSSQSGAFDLLDALGVTGDTTPAAVRRSLTLDGLALCPAPAFHPALRQVAPVRQELGIRTVFNVLGPLVNPGQPPASLLGAADTRHGRVMAEVLAARGRAGLVVRGEEGLDEFSPEGSTRIWHVVEGQVTEVSVSPRDLGLDPLPAAGLRGADPGHNAEVTRRVLDPDAGGMLGPTDLNTVRQSVLLTAAAALVAVEQASGRRLGEPAAGPGAPERPCPPGLQQRCWSPDSSGIGPACPGEGSGPRCQEDLVGVP